MTSSDRDRANRFSTQFVRHLPERILGQAAQVFRTLDRVQQRGW